MLINIWHWLTAWWHGMRVATTMLLGLMVVGVLIEAYAPGLIHKERPVTSNVPLMVIAWLFCSLWFAPLIGAFIALLMFEQWQSDEQWQSLERGEFLPQRSLRDQLIPLLTDAKLGRFKQWANEWSPFSFYCRKLPAAIWWLLGRLTARFHLGAFA